MLSMHSSPLAQPGVGDSGGMNVYVRELVVGAGPGRRRLHHLRPALGPRPARRGGGRAGLPRRPHRRRRSRPAQGAAASTSSGSSPPASSTTCARHGGADLIHANYWLSGVAGHRIKHELDLPLVCTFHTLARVKAEGGDAESARRERAETEIIGCADAICVSCTEEERQFRRLYGDPPGRVEIVAPGRRARVLRPGDRMGARRRPGSGPGSRAGAAVRRAASSRSRASTWPCARWPRSTARTPSLVIVGGASGQDGDAEVEKLVALVDELGLARRRSTSSRRSPTTCCRATTGPPTWCSCRADRRASASSRWRRRRAARRSWPPASVGCSRWSTTATPASWSPGRDPEVFASYTDELLGNDRLAAEMGVSGGRQRSRGYTWSLAAARLRRLYADLDRRRAGRACT